MKFRSFGGIQPYPSRTKDHCEVDFSTGSVGLGAAATTFAALTERYLRLKGLPPKAWPGVQTQPERPGRMIALVGDAELDEGNVFECLMESWKLNVPNNWSVVRRRRSTPRLSAPARVHRRLHCVWTPSKPPDAPPSCRRHHASGPDVFDQGTSSTTTGSHWTR